MPSNDVSAPHPQHTYAANAARLSCLLPPPPRLDIVAVSTLPLTAQRPACISYRPAPLLPLPPVHTTSATRVRMGKVSENLRRKSSCSRRLTGPNPPSLPQRNSPRIPLLHLHTFINRAMLPFRPSNVQTNPLAWITRQRRCAASTAASPVISSGLRRGCFNPDFLEITRRMLGVHLVVLRPRRARPITTGYLLCKPVDPSGFQGAGRL
ncbi:hypothetical protein R3P38DRAFT_3379769 [Favolaschia claudopus]|uniref:Uncharacterized protein n=1 Tax=Favolaschia claudopus TaxID=2862362 RepID=A0AAV9Z554_9AGAR